MTEVDNSHFDANSSGWASENDPSPANEESVNDRDVDGKCNDQIDLRHEDAHAQDPGSAERFEENHFDTDESSWLNSDLRNGEMGSPLETGSPDDFRSTTYGLEIFNSMESDKAGSQFGDIALDTIHEMLQTKIEAGSPDDLSSALSGIENFNSTEATHTEDQSRDVALQSIHEMLYTAASGAAELRAAADDAPPQASIIDYDYSNVNVTEHEVCQMAADIAVEMCANAPPGLIGAFASEAGPLASVALETAREMLESSEAAKEVAKEVTKDLCDIVLSTLDDASSAHRP